jgi:hypothetical protein
MYRTALLRQRNIGTIEDQNSYHCSLLELILKAARKVSRLCSATGYSRIDSSLPLTSVQDRSRSQYLPADLGAVRLAGVSYFVNPKALSFTVSSKAAWKQCT